MKRTVLKRSVENLLIGINAMIFTLTMMMNDFELWGLPIIIGAWVLFFVNIKILEKYGRTM